MLVELQNHLREDRGLRGEAKQTYTSRTKYSEPPCSNRPLLTQNFWDAFPSQRVSIALIGNSNPPSTLFKGLVTINPKWIKFI